MRGSRQPEYEPGGGDWVAYCIGIAFLLLLLPCLCLLVWGIILGVTVGSNGGTSTDPNLQGEVDYIIDVLNTCNITNSTCPTDTNITGLEMQVENNTEILMNCNLTQDSCGGVQGPPGANGTCTDEQCNSTTLRQDIDEIDNILDTCGITNTTCPDMCWNCPTLGTCIARNIALFEPKGDGSPNQDVGFTRMGTGALTVTELGNYGDCRGDYAIDFQRFRSATNQVASASYSVILNGMGNLNGGEYSTIANGADGLIQSQRSFIGSGVGNQVGASSPDSAVLVGTDNTINNSDRSVIAGGVNCQIANGTTTMLYGSNLQSIPGNTKPVVGIGQFNDPLVTHMGEQTMFFIGSGDDGLSRRNALTVSDTGHIRLAPTGSVTIGGAFSMSMWMEHDEKRRLKWGSTVILLPNGKFREALPGERPDFVVVPPNAGFVNGAAEEHWHQMYVLNEKTMQFDLNPQYNPEKVYIPRSKRPEWHVVSGTGFVEVLNRAAKHYEHWIHLKEKQTVDPLKSWWYIP